MRAPHATRRRIAQATALAAMLTFVAGFVDLVGYVALYHVFTANMTGNTIAIGRGLFENDIGVALRRGFAIPMFVLGLLASRLCVHVATRRRVRSIAGWLFAAEALLLAAFVVLGHGMPSDAAIEQTPLYYLLVALPAFAMGLQNATLTHFGPLSVRTTHVTGNLAKFADAFAQYLVWLHARIAVTHRLPLLAESHQEPSFRKSLLLAGVFLCYLAGAIIGAWLYSRFRLLALIVPIAGLVAIVAVEFRWPRLPRGEGAVDSRSKERERP
jgi:uncharacterized membrane protein YoaK (UPF0700 family)